MEVLAGAGDEAHAVALRRLVGECEFVPTIGLDDFEQGAVLYRECRRAGQTIRALNDCLIAAIAIRTRLDVLQADRNFDTLARHSTLRIH